MYDFIIIGGGIIGLSVGRSIYNRYPDAKIAVLEKEDRAAMHQTGHNSGVIHSGIYYKPGSDKAEFASAGNRSMIEFCQKQGIEHKVCGKIIVATKREELARLDSLFQRGLDNGLDIKKLRKEEIGDYEPYVQGLGAIHVPTAGIVNYQQVCDRFIEIIKEQGGRLLYQTKVKQTEETNEGIIVSSNQGPLLTRYLINCAGLQSDRIATASKLALKMRIVPFKGKYYELKPEKRNLVNNLIYPVPHPDFPFLGVHFTKMIGGKIEAGPNAILSLSREGYKKTDFNLIDLSDVLFYPGFWRLASKHWKEGIEEMVRSFSKKAFVNSLQQLIPEIDIDDLVPAEAGIRAQAVTKQGHLLDDFYIVSGRKSIHICNAPSPAATASIQIGEAVVARINL